MNRTLITAIGIILAFCAGIFFYAEWQKQKFDASLPEPPAPTEVQTAETETEGGHWHGDEWHAEPHNAAFAVPIEDEAELDLSVQPTASAETVSEEQFSAELTDILATPKYVEKLQAVRKMASYAPKWAEWEEQMILLEAEGELLEQKNPFWEPDGTATREEIEKNLIEENQRIANMTREEQLALVEEAKAYSQKRDAWWERHNAHAAKMPFSLQGGQQ